MCHECIVCHCSGNGRNYIRKDLIQLWLFLRKQSESNLQIQIQEYRIASCGCTVPQYPKEPIKPGESGEVTVTYNGAGKFPGHFRKTITLRTNSKNEITRLVVEGDMTPASADINQ